MSPRALAILFGVTVIAVVAAVIASPGGGRAGEGVPDRLLPGLERRLDEVARVAVQRGEERITLSRTAGGWVVVEKDNYPADTRAVASLLLDVADLSPVERKTADPALHSRIGVDEPADGGRGTVVELKGADGGRIAGVVIGRRGPIGGRFVRVMGEERAWLVDQSLDVRADALAFITRELVRLPMGHVRRVTVQHPGEPAVVIERLAEGEAFALAGVPDGRAPADGADLESTARAMAFLALNDVRAHSGPAPAGAAVTTYETFDGVRVSAAVWRDDDGRAWAALDVSAAEGSAAGVVEEARQVHQRVSGWAYAIDDGRAAALTPTWDDLTEER